jgi:WD40 repeat protein
MAQLTLVMTPPPSGGGTLSPGDSPSLSAKRGFFDKILRRKSILQSGTPRKTPSKAGSIIAKSQFGDHRRPSVSPVPRKSNQLRSSSVRSSRSNRYSFSEPSTFVDNDSSSLYDYDTYGEDERTIHTEPMSETSSVNSLNSFDKTTKPFHAFEDGDKIKFPSLENNSYDKIAIDIKAEEEPPCVGTTYEALVSPKYIKTSKKNKHSPRVLNKVFLAQELDFADDEITLKTRETETFSNPSHTDEDSLDSANSILELSEDPQEQQNKGSEIFIMEFSRDGKFLAAAGHDTLIKVWKVISSPLGRLESKNDDHESHRKKKLKHQDRIYSSAPVFHQKPVKVFRGHTQSILSLNWSKNNFLISGSMDRTAKLWHVDKEECLHTFQHEDFVTAVKFHPNDDRFFLSGSLDNNVRLWSILESSVAYTRNLGSDVLITALVVTPDGEYCIVGGFNGSVFSMETKGLHVKARFDIKERSLAHPFEKNGNKITGIKVFENSETSEENELPLSKWSFLLTTNDSKIRLINTTQKKLVTRFKGLTNNSSSIVADISDDNKYIVSGSEDHWVYVWENNNSIINNKVKLAIKELVKESKLHLSDLLQKHKKYAKLAQDGKLMKLLAEDQLDIIANENNSYASFHAHHSRVNAAIFAPDTTRKLLEFSDDIIFDLIKRGKACNLSNDNRNNKKGDDHSVASESLSQSSAEGHIIVTTDQYGLIRVFRQDAARDIRKKFQSLQKNKHCSNKHENTAPMYQVAGKPLAKLDSNKSLICKIATHGRSMSPTHEGYFTRKIHSKVRTPPTTSGSYRSTVSSSEVLSKHSSTGVPRIISSSSIMTQNLKPQVNTTPPTVFSHPELSFDIDEEHVESPVSSKGYDLHDDKHENHIEILDTFNSRHSTLNNGTPPSMNPSMDPSMYPSSNPSISDSLASVSQIRVHVDTPLQNTFTVPPKSRSNSSIPLILRTDTDNTLDNNEVVDFKTPVDNIDSFHEQVSSLSVKPSRPKSHKRWPIV